MLEPLKIMRFIRIDSRIIERNQEHKSYLFLCILTCSCKVMKNKWIEIKGIVDELKKEN